MLSAGHGERLLTYRQRTLRRIFADRRRGRKRRPERNGKGKRSCFSQFSPLIFELPLRMTWERESRVPPRPVPIGEGFISFSHDRVEKCTLAFDRLRRAFGFWACRWPSSCGRPSLTPVRMRKIGRCTTRRHRHAYNRGETAIGRSNAGRLEEKWRFPAKGSKPGDRGHPCHARRRGRLRLFRHGHRPDVLQADARRQGPLVLPQSVA